MALIIPLRRANHGWHFRACCLHGAAGQTAPFIGVEHAWMSGPRTQPPANAARGSVLTYLFLDSATGLERRDAAGLRERIRPGGLQWAGLHAASTHYDAPAEAGKTVHLLQIVIGLPCSGSSGESGETGESADNLRPGSASIPQSLTPQDVPVLHLPGVKVRVLLGELDRFRSPLQAPMPLTLLDITLQAGTSWSAPLRAGDSAFVMPIFGAVQADGLDFGHNDLRIPLYPPGESTRNIVLQATAERARLVLFAGPDGGVCQPEGKEIYR